MQLLLHIAMWYSPGIIKSFYTISSIFLFNQCRPVCAAFYETISDIVGYQSYCVRPLILKPLHIQKYAALQFNYKRAALSGFVSSKIKSRLLQTIPEKTSF